MNGQDARRLLALAVAGGALFFVIDLFPPTLYWLAWASVLALGFVGGLLAKSFVDLVVLSAGSAVGGVISGLLQLGTPNGASSVVSILAGASFLAGLVFVVGAIARASARRSRHPHQDPDLEACLPAAVAGRPLTRWSMRGEAFLGGALHLGQDGLDALSLEWRSKGLDLEDAAMAIAGRSQVNDPPYMIHAYRFAGVPPSDLETRLGLPAKFPLVEADASGLAETMVAGKAVLKGTLAMVGQDDHLRGLPYVYDAGDIRFVVVTDSQEWATDALRQLP